MNDGDNILNESWVKLKAEKFENSTLNKTDVMNAINKESNLALDKLRTRARQKMNWIIFFILMFSVWMLFSLGNKDLLLVLGVINASYIISLIALWPKYKSMASGSQVSDNTLQMMKQSHSALMGLLSIERFFGVIGFPLSLIVGALLSRIYNGYTIVETVADNRWLIFVIIAIIVVVPFMYLLSEFMNKKAFGDLKQRLENNITKLELLQ